MQVAQSLVLWSEKGGKFRRNLLRFYVLYNFVLSQKNDFTLTNDTIFRKTLGVNAIYLIVIQKENCILHHYSCVRLKNQPTLVYSHNFYSLSHKRNILCLSFLDEGY